MMKQKHELTRDPDGFPGCACGYRPEILEHLGLASVAMMSGPRLHYTAKTDVLDHIEAQDRTTRRSPESPFRVPAGSSWPRAGVRQLPDGGWLLTLWDQDRVVPVIDERDRRHTDRYTAATQGWLTVGACRASGVNLEGMPAL